LVGEMTETIEGTDAVRAFGRERDRLDALAAANRDVTARYLDGTNMRIQFYSSITVIRTTATAIVVIVASLLAVDGRLSVGTAAAGALAVSSVFGPLAWFTELLDDLLSARAALERVVGAAQLAATSTGTATLPARGDVVFEGVSFSYVPGRPVLDGVDLHVPSGARVALVGETGAGKSTIARLAAGLATPTAGAVRVGGVDLRDASEDARRARLLFVLQETLCTSGTIADNLRLVAPDATDAELLDAARRVGADAWLSAHDDGLGRDVGVGGSHLSVGERQLVTAMRVALADPAVVILDEATASLDPELEDLVGRALDRALGDRTVLVIAHRPTTAARCDQVVLVEHGRVQPVTARS
ncbi:MAG TPA: ABC transporter ATP-binding protein, partial [Acidimicrobiales bacterium]|nr:ABC transporter ATP-binding protein [Acidimicrobiales bacterium]